MMSRDGQGGEGYSGTLDCVEKRLDRLHNILKEQLERVHQGRLTAVEELCECATECVAMIAGNQVVDAPALAQRQQCLRRLYEELCLALAAQHAEVSEALVAVCRGKRILKVYGNRTV